MRQHSAARPRSGYFGVTLILNHLIGPSERRRIECCLRPIRARLRPVRTKLLRNVSRARDMGLSHLEVRGVHHNHACAA